MSFAVFFGAPLAVIALLPPATGEQVMKKLGPETDAGTLKFEWNGDGAHSTATEGFRHVAALLMEGSGCQGRARNFSRMASNSSTACRSLGRFIARLASVIASKSRTRISMSPSRTPTLRARQAA